MADVQAQVSVLAQRVVAAGREAGYDLDYSESSIEVVDEMIDAVWGDRKPWRKGKAKKQHIHTAGPAVGAYVGEVMVRHLEGEWAEHPEQGVVGVRLPNELWVFPLQKGAKRFANGHEDSLLAMYEISRDIARGAWDPDGER